MKIDPDDLAPPKEPYRGILPFRLLDWRIFLEREVEAEILGNLVSMYSGVLLYGQSGAGKSSLVNAGLIPRALRQGWAPERIRVFPEHDRELLIERIQLQEGEEGEVGSTKKLPRYLPSRFTSSDDDERVALSCEKFLETLHMSSKPDSALGVPLLIFDQFEELVTLFEENPKDAERFKEAREARSVIDRMLCELLLNDPIPFKIVFAFRDDYLARLGPLFSRIPNLMDQRVRMASLPVELLKQIVRGPFVRSKDGEQGLPGHFGDELSEELADKITVGMQASKPSGLLNLSEVQTLCLALWQQPKRQKELLRADNPAAVLQEIIESTAADALKQFLPWDRVRALALLANLVTQEGTRNVVSEENLISETRRNPLMWVFPRDWRKLLKELPKKTGLLRSSLSSGTTYYELTSEFLISWIQKRQRAFRTLALLVSGLISVVSLAVLAVLAVLYIQLKFQKQIAQNERNNATAQTKIAENQRKNAIKQKNKAEAAEQRAIQQSEIAIEQKKIAQEETLRARKQNFEDNNLIQIMADRLVELSTPQEALFWRQQKAGALARIGSHEDSINEYDLILQLDPQNLGARLGRGYENYTQNVEKALQDTEAYLAKVSISWRAHQNLGIFLGFQGRYTEAEKAIRNSIQDFQLTARDLMEFHVAEDIKRATGRTILSADEKVAPTANYYELANLKAYAGSEEFDAVLTKADKQPNRADAALFALNWAWMQMEERKEDYGALVAQGALWQRVGFKERAKQSYQEFERIHTKNKDKRYESLASWAARRLAELKSVGPVLDEKPGVDMLVRESLELFWRNKADDALKRINIAIDLEGDNAMLYLYRAWILWKLERYPECKSDCDRILFMKPNTALAYRLRANANFEGTGTPESIEEDYRKALEYSPGDGVSMVLLSSALYDRAKKKGFGSSRRELDEALQLLNRSASAGNVDFNQLPSIYYMLAQVHCARRDFEEANKSLETAIAIKDDDPSLYTLWREIQKGWLGKNEAQVSCRLAGVYRQTAETKLRSGHSAKALDFCWRALETLTADEKQIHDAEVKKAMDATMSEISQIIEGAGSRAKAMEFWQSIAKLENMKVLWDGAKDELKRLARPR